MIFWFYVSSPTSFQPVHIAIHSWKLDYNVPFDLSMQQIAQSLKDEQKKLPSEASFSDVRLEEAESNSLTKSGMLSYLNFQYLFIQLRNLYWVLDVSQAWNSLYLWGTYTLWVEIYNWRNSVLNEMLTGYTGIFWIIDDLWGRELQRECTVSSRGWSQGEMWVWKLCVFYEGCKSQVTSGCLRYTEQHVGRHARLENQGCSGKVHWLSVFGHRLYVGKKQARQARLW